MASQYANTDFKLAGPLAGLYTGIGQAQEEERQGLVNAYQAAITPQKLLEGQEAMGKMQDPRYLQMKLQTDLSELGNKYDESQLQASQNKWTRAAIAIKTSADPVATTKQLMTENNIPEDSPMGQMLLKDPMGTSENMLNTLAMLRSRTSKQTGLESLENVKGEWDIKKTRALGEEQRKTASVRASSGDSAADKARNKILTAGPQSVVNYAGAALSTGIDPLTKKPIDESDRMILQAYYDEAQATLEGKGGGGLQITPQGVVVQPKGVRKIPGRTGSNDLSGTASAFAPTNNDPLGIR